MISPASIADAARAVDLLRLSYDDRLNTVAGLRYRFESIRPEDRMRFWRAERDGALVGWAYAGLDVFAPVCTTGFAGIVVHPDNRRRGIGSALWEDVVSPHLTEIGATRILGDSWADPGTVSFLERRGFSLEATETSSAVDPRTIGPPPPLPEDVRYVSLATFASDPEPVYVADREAMLDEPGPSDHSGVTFDIWRRLIWDHPDYDHELSGAALVDGAVVGTTFLFTDRSSGRALNGGTGVRRDFRGRGIGLLMKQHSLARAAAASITRVITANDDTNAPMLAINARLGYEPFSVGHAWVLER